MTTSRRLIHSDTKSISEILAGKTYTYRVPIYQRSYAWKAEQVDALWDDITSALEERQAEYFLGTIVLSYTEDESKREIVDGQQRLATISMMFSAIAGEWERRNDHIRAEGVSRDYLGSVDRRTNEIVAHLTLNEINDHVFQTVVVERQEADAVNKKAWEDSNKLIEAAFNRIRDKLASWLKDYTDSREALLNLEEFISRKTKLIVIEAGDESDAFIIFETLNDRGLELAVSDLVKNYLLRQAGKPQIEKFKRAWSETLENVGEQNMSQYLRHYWMSEYKLVRERQLYGAIRDQVQKSNAKYFVDSLREKSVHYAALSDPDHSFWRTYPIQARTYLKDLQLFTAVLHRPLALAIMKMWQPKDATQALQMLMVIVFRYNIIASQRPSKAEEVYSEAAISVNMEYTTGPRELFARLKPLYIDDDTFRNDFAHRPFSGRSIIPKYILSEINAHLEQNREKRVDQDTITLEHILPQTLKEGWPNISASVEHPQYVNRIGNLTLLEKSVNQGIGNASFEIKRRKAYAKSTLALNRDLANLTAWGVEEIEERSARLADLAVGIWCIPQ